jgi:hypothetical protein
MEARSKPSEMRALTDSRMRWASAAAVEPAALPERPPGVPLALLFPAGDCDSPSDTRDRMDEPRSLLLLEAGREETGEEEREEAGEIMALLLAEG